MSYSSVPECNVKSRKEVDNIDNDPRETRHRYSYHEMQYVPRSSALASTVDELRREFESRRYKQPTLANVCALGGYTYEASIHRPDGDRHGIVRCMKALSLQQDTNPAKLVQAEHRRLYKTETTIAPPPSEGKKRHNDTQVAWDEQPDSSNCPLNRSEGVDIISKNEKKLDGSTKHAEAGLYNHQVEEVAVQSNPCVRAADMMNITTNDNKPSAKVQYDGQGLILMLLEDLVYRSSFLREIGSWAQARGMLDQHGEETQPDSVKYPETIIIDLNKTERSNEDQNGKITQCVGSTETRRPNASNQASQSTKSPTRVGEAATNANKGKRKRTNNNSDDDENEEDIEQADNDSPQKSYKLACPFFKRHSQTFRTNQEHRYKFRTCETTTFPNITRLKEHLLRKHKQPITCPRCQEVFNDDDLLVRHLKEAERCPERPTQLVMAITPSVETKLRRKTLVPDPIVKWREIYSWIFPGDVVLSPSHEDLPEAATPTLGIDTSFFSMVTRDMPKLLRSELEPLLFRLGFSDGERACLTDMAVVTVALCHRKLWQTYQEQQSNSIEPLPESLELKGSNPNLAHTHSVEPRSDHNVSAPHTYRNLTQATPFTEQHLLPTYNTQTRFPPTPNTAGASMIFAAPTAYNNHNRLPPTPGYLETSPPFGVASISSLVKRSSGSWKSDSGYGTLPPCGKISCDESSCMECLELMQSPTSKNLQLPTKPPFPFQPVAGDPRNVGFPWHGHNSHNALAPACDIQASTTGAAEHQYEDDDDGLYPFLNYWY